MSDTGLPDERLPDTRLPDEHQPVTRLPVTRLRTVALWSAFVVVHLVLSVAVLNGPHTPLNDVTTVYHGWIQDGLRGDGWVGIDTVWVYPTLALLPMLLSAAFGLGVYSYTWLVLVAVLDAVGFAALTRGGTRRARLGIWWLGFLLLLGPIAVGRIDTVTVPIALIGLLIVVRRPVAAGILIAVATWMKVWPAAVLLAIVVASKRRILVIAGAFGLSLAVVLAVLLLGGSWSVIVSFVGQQTGRGLQLEAPVTTYWLWLEAARVPGVTTAFDRQLLTYQVTGPGTDVAGALMTPIMALVLAGILALGIVVTRRGAPATALIAPLSLALTTAFIVTNKVGSPQYEAWLAVPVLAGLVAARRGAPSFALPAVLSLVIAGLTQVVYPWAYDPLVVAAPWIVAVLSLRNLLLVALLVVAVRQVWLVREAPGETRELSAVSDRMGA